MKPLAPAIVLPLLLSGQPVIAAPNQNTPDLKSTSQSALKPEVKPELSEQQLSSAISHRLQAQLNDPQLAEELTAFLMQQVLTWKAETRDVKQADSIIAYSFGNRIDEKGNKLPGPMNEQLADLVVDLYNQNPKPVYAQWEVAQAIGDRIAPQFLFSIYPKIDAGGEVIYLNTLGVAEEAARLAKGTKQLGTAIVVAFYDHSLRAVNLSREVGIDAYSPKGYALPNHYDADSGQPWTRSREAFILYEIKTRAAYEAEGLLKTTDSIQ
ncbi:hypothetical protein [Shewanella surugensis]|uniref:Lipoprotein n=1 Tax=Shewanella surugensis TaxID=212020 RepID=A0ABT0L5J4_9GAMM|nr:hypothetical protein [Shewanella surugensis]MCL1122958.1 hypothetical protein [Shewanella surugensis]